MNNSRNSRIKRQKIVRLLNERKRSRKNLSSSKKVGKISLRKIINEELRNVLLEQDSSAEISIETEMLKMPQEQQDFLASIQAAVAEITTSEEALEFEKRLAAALNKVGGEESRGAAGTAVAGKQQAGGEEESEARTK